MKDLQVCRGDVWAEENDRRRGGGTKRGYTSTKPVEAYLATIWVKYTSSLLIGPGRDPSGTEAACGDSALPRHQTNTRHE